MPLIQLLTAGGETLLNHLLQQDPDSPARLRPLCGQVLALQLHPLPGPLYLVFSAQRVDLLSQFEGEPDCRVSLQLSSLSSLGLLMDSNRIPEAIREGSLSLEGELACARHFADLMGGLKPDAEEQLSRYTGDIAAHQLMQLLRTTGELINDRLQLLQHNLGDYLREESGLAPGPLEVAGFCDQVSDCRDQLAALEQRIERLERRSAQPGNNQQEPGQ